MDTVKTGKKLYVYVSEETGKRFTELARRYGLTLSQLGNLCIMSGMNSFLRSVSPEEAFTSEKLAEIIRALGITDEDIRSTLAKKE